MKTVEQRTQEIIENIPRAIIKDTPANVKSIMDCTLTMSITIISLLSLTLCEGGSQSKVNILIGIRSNNQLKWGEMKKIIAWHCWGEKWKG